MKNTLLSLVFALLSISGVCLAQDHPKVGIVPSDEGLFPFVISYDLAKGATDFSSLLDAPAGKHGFTRIEGQHFVNDAGRIRFNGVNIVGGACFPSHEQAERLAARLAHLGVNCVRLHYFDLINYNYRAYNEKGLLEDDGTWCTINPEQLDLFDYMIYQFKKHGIYYNINLLVGRRTFKGINAYDKDIQQKELDYARKLFTHVNPYTGLTFPEDPAMAMVELNNEDSIFTSYRGQKEWSPEKGEPAWKTLEELKNSTAEQKLEMYDNLKAADKDHWMRQKDLLVNELGVKVPVASTQVNYSSPWALTDMDYYDMHAYWCHPHHQRDVDRWFINNIPMINDPNCGKIPQLAAYRPSDRPYTISEYNHPFPNLYGAEGLPMLHAYGAFQGWDGEFAHSWNNLSNEEPDFLPYHFTCTSRTDVVAHFICCGTMFLRADVRESSEQYVQNLPYDFFREMWTKQLNHQIEDMLVDATDSTFFPWERFTHRVATDYFAKETKSFSKEEPQAVKITDGGQIEWNNEDPEQGMFIVRTENTKLFSGFPAGRTIDWGDGISFTVGQTKLGWTTMSLVSKKANGFRKRGTALLVATGYTKHSNQVLTAEPDSNDPSMPSTFIHCRHEAWGNGPMLTEGIPATLKLASKARKTRCWALDESGKRCSKVPVKKDSEGKAVIEIGQQYKTVWYEIKVK